MVQAELIDSPWFKRNNPERKYEEKVCAPVSLEELKSVIKAHKDERSLGIDGISAKLVKHAGVNSLICSKIS